MGIDELLEGIWVEHQVLLAQMNLTEDRLRHLDGCIRSAYRLAGLYGLDRSKAVLAALLHDFFREKGREEILRLATENGVVPTPFEERFYKVLHGKVAVAYFLGQEYLRDEEVLEAIEHHTLSAPGAGALARLMFIVDAVEPYRSYPGVEEIRSYAESHGLDDTYAHVLGRQIADMTRKGKILPLATVEAYNEIMEERHQ